MLRDVAARRLDQLDALPADVGERIRGLQDYDFLEPHARERFDELVKKLQGQVLDQFVAGMSEAIKTMRPEDLAANREMVRDLNELIRQRIGGGDPDASEFLAKHGQFFPGAQTFDDIIDQLAQRMAAMQSLMRSMSPEQRAELSSMMEALLRDDRILVDLAQLASNLDMLLPGGLGDRVPFGGEEPLGLEGALAQIGRLQAMDRLEDALSDVASPADLAAIDRDEVRDLLGDDALRELEALDDLARRLEEAGYLTRDGEHMELTPRGSRKIGQKVLDDLFARLQRDAFGGHRIDRGGRGGERDEATKPYEFGDPFHLDLRGTLFNALGREENAPAARAATGDRRVRLAPSDFEVHRTEQLTQTSTVLLVDMSRSMLLRGCFLAAKKVAVALDTLIRTQYPRDHLSVIGFAYYAREIRPGALAELSWHGYEYGTNLQHGLLLARPDPRADARGQQGDRGHHGRRADRPFRERPGRVQLPADPPDDPGDPPRGAALHEGGDHDQHVHARTVPGARRVRRPHDAAQPGPRLLRDPGAPRRVRPGRFREPADQEGLLTSPARIGPNAGPSAAYPSQRPAPGPTVRWR